MALRPDSPDAGPLQLGHEGDTPPTLPRSAGGPTLSMLLAERDSINEQIARAEDRLFRVESAYIELTGGVPLSRSLEFYLNSRAAKKISAADVPHRIFASEYPGSNSC